MAEMTSEQEASTMGWVPQDKFKGDPAKWVPAEEFLERGRSLMPILKRNNADLLVKLDESRTRTRELAETVNTLKKTQEELLKFQAEEIKRQVDAQLKSLRVQHAEALKDGDTSLAAELEGEIDEAKARKAAVAAPAPAPAPTATGPKVEPWAQEFANDNADWWGKDKRRTALVVGLAEELGAADPTLRGRPLLDKAKEQMEEILSPSGRPVDKTEGGSRGGGGGSGNTGGSTYSDLPSEAKAQAKADAKRFVGPNKLYKTEAEWNAHYAKIYFGN